MRRSTWIPWTGGFAVVIGLGIPAGVYDWSAPAVYGVLFVSSLTWATLLAFTDGGGRPSSRR
jgi:hypothetical protein